MRSKVLPIRDAREGKGLQQTGDEIKARSVAKKGIRDLPTCGLLHDLPANGSHTLGQYA